MIIEKGKLDGLVAQLQGDTSRMTAVLDQMQAEALKRLSESGVQGAKVLEDSWGTFLQMQKDFIAKTIEVADRVVSLETRLLSEDWIGLLGLFKGEPSTDSVLVRDYTLLLLRGFQKWFNGKQDSKPYFTRNELNYMIEALETWAPGAK